MNEDVGNTEILTETELLLMKILWDLKEGSIHQIMESLPSNRMMAYTSVSTIVRILEKKGHVESRKVGRGHVYRSVKTKEHYEKKFLENYTENLFSDQASGVFKSLLKTNKMDSQELSKIEKLIRQYKKGKLL